MKALAVILGHDVEEEGVRVVIECLVVEEALGQKAQVLGVTLQRQRYLLPPCRCIAPTHPPRAGHLRPCYPVPMEKGSAWGKAQLLLTYVTASLLPRFLHC